MEVHCSLARDTIKPNPYSGRRLTAPPRPQSAVAVHTQADASVRLTSHPGFGDKHLSSSLRQDCLRVMSSMTRGTRKATLSRVRNDAQYQHADIGVARQKRDYQRATEDTIHKDVGPHRLKAPTAHRDSPLAVRLALGLGLRRLLRTIRIIGFLPTAGLSALFISCRAVGQLDTSTA